MDAARAQTRVVERGPIDDRRRIEEHEIRFHAGADGAAIGQLQPCGGQGRHFADRLGERERDPRIAGEMFAGGVLSWEQAGRPVAGAILILAAGYELTPLKNVCLGKCRSPLGTLLGSWRDGWSGALRMGAKNGAWCVGCCWALMASLFALGVMSVTWMAIVAGLIAIEKILPWRRTATYGTALVLLALGVFVLVAPDALPGLTVPGQHSMPAMAPGH